MPLVGDRGLDETMRCVTADLIVRDAVPSDARACAAVYEGYVTDSAISFETDPPTVEEMARRIVTSQASHAWIVAEAAGDVVGYACATRHRSGWRTGSHAMSACISTLPGSATGSGAVCMSRCCLVSPRPDTAWRARGSLCPTPRARRCTGRWGSRTSGPTEGSGGSTDAGTTSSGFSCLSVAAAIRGWNGSSQAPDRCGAAAQCATAVTGTAYRLMGGCARP